MSAASTPAHTAGAALHDFARRVYRIPRSLTGDGVRATLREVALELGDLAPRLTIHEVPTGAPLLDWTAPREWNLTEAWIRGPHGEVVAHTRDHLLHLVGYSVPIRTRLSRKELDAHLHSLPEHPDWIPYRTSYWRETWGFCLPDRVRRALPEGEYEVCVDATLADGHLTYGELFLPGSGSDELLISTHVCHPQLANDNLSGIVVATELARRWAAGAGGAAPRRHALRLLFVPGTIGAIAWLARNEERLQHIVGGLVLANLGDPGGFHLKASRRGGTPIERAALVAGRDLGASLATEPFTPFGYDERQYGSPGFDLPVASLSRTPWGRYPEYHTSADDLDFIQPQALDESVRLILATLETLEANRAYRNLLPKGEPQLGRRGLYSSLGGGHAGEQRERELALLWVLNQSTGEVDLLSIAERSGIPFERLARAARELVGADLLAPA